MGHKFNAVQKQILNAIDGAYSIVTAGDEDTKGQITITANEVDVVENWFGKANIHTGPAKADIVKATKPFLIYGTSNIAYLKLVYPKPAKSELRLYMNKTEGFRPSAGDVWFVFEPINGSNMVLGWMDQNSWSNLGSVDTDDDQYQIIYTAKPAGGAVTVTTSKYPRSYKVGLNRMQAANFQCEVDPAHITFISASSGNRYVEPHHLVPMAAQPDFINSLDTEANIVVLCPNCHKAIHLADRAQKEILIRNSYLKHQALLTASGIDISLDALFRYYNL